MCCGPTVSRNVHMSEFCVYEIIRLADVAMQNLCLCRLLSRNLCLVDQVSIYLRTAHLYTQKTAEGTTEHQNDHRRSSSMLLAHVKLHFGCLCSVVVTPTPTLVKRTYTWTCICIHADLGNTTAGLTSCLFDYTYESTARYLRSTFTRLVTSPTQLQDSDGRPAGKCLCGERTRLPASADTAQSAAPRSRSARNERSMDAVVGGEIDRGTCTAVVYTEEEGVGSDSVLLLASSTGCVQ